MITDRVPSLLFRSGNSPGPSVLTRSESRSTRETTKVWSPRLTFSGSRELNTATAHRTSPSTTKKVTPASTGTMARANGDRSLGSSTTSVCQQVEQRAALRASGWSRRHAAALERRCPVAHVGAMAEIGDDAVVDHRPHPVDLLALALDQLARRLERRAMAPRSGDHTSSRPRRSARCTSRPAVPRRSRGVTAGAARRRARAPPCSASTTCGPSALLTAITSASSSTPFLMPCSSSPVRASMSSRKKSTMSATAVSDWPTPTVSTSTTS